MSFGETITAIEQFMGRPFGTLPDIEFLNLKNALDADYKLFPETSLNTRIERAKTKLEKKNPFYMPELHLILIPEDADVSSLVHECMHAYTNNHWPEIYTIDVKKETGLVNDMLSEGLAEYVSHKTTEQARLRQEILLAWAGKPFFHTYTRAHLNKARDELIAEALSETYKRQLAIYGVGALVVASTLEGAEDMHAAYDGLVTNLPRTIKAATSIIDPKIHETYWTCKHNKFELFIIEKLFGLGGDELE